MPTTPFRSSVALRAVMVSALCSLSAHDALAQEPPWSTPIRSSLSEGALGSALCMIGDVDRDSYLDLAVASPGLTLGGYDAGIDVLNCLDRKRDVTHAALTLRLD